MKKLSLALLVGGLVGLYQLLDAPALGQAPEAAACDEFIGSAEFGCVVLSVWVDDDGKIEKCEALASVPPEIEKAYREAGCEEAQKYEYAKPREKRIPMIYYRFTFER